MGKIHVLLKKEEIDAAKMAGKTVAVFDILLATSTITSLLEHGAEEVIPVLNEQRARETAAGMADESYLLAGEYEGKTIHGFLDPNPSLLKDKVSGKKVILSTTNGTVALHRSSPASFVYACSLLNSGAMAEHFLKFHKEDSIILVCSGSSGQFCLEDFYGAGFFISCLLAGSQFELTDSARAAWLFAASQRQEAENLLKASAVGRMLEDYGFSEEISYISQHSCYGIVASFNGSKMLPYREMTK
ncbi:2-phosphosulfolactate phosphatase [Metabacillus sp. GX 13764]|uniref:2-phosphosulfolactate phosphatase n=1 Tax=Metabacillus kandeliae TaxID=2900151 RepID=UPI001E3AB5EE|nr:2-phosphosulfolactate phosphatase [Metabacillus kandeliae]MCD7032697.1 2-phosphosulfolactate phosphatase [Metabacillus kandeliae]